MNWFRLSCVHLGPLGKYMLTWLLNLTFIVFDVMLTSCLHGTVSSPCRYVAGEHYYAISDFLAQVNIGPPGSDTFVSASHESVLKGLASPSNTMDPLTQDVVFGDEMPPDAFPVVGYAYWYLKKSPTGYHDCYQAWLVAKFIEWTYTDPQASSIALKHGWVVPPPHVVEEAMSHLSEIQCIDEGGNPEAPIFVFDYTPPRFYHEENYISSSLDAVGYFLLAVMTFMSLVCALFLYLNRKEWHVKVSQPQLLGVVILGCFLSSLSIPFMGSETGQHQDNIDFVDSSCMVVPWFYGIGFVLTFSMLFAKIMRVKLIFVAANDQTKTGKKKKIGLSSVIHIVAFMLLFELAILVSWQVFSPLEWQREITAEENGLVVESYGECRSDYGFFFYAALVIFHILCLLYALVLCIQTSHIDSSFAESKYISLSVAFMFQVLLLAVPISALVRDNTEVFYLVRVLAIFLQNFTVLALLFIPKMMKVVNDGNAARLEKQPGTKTRKAKIKLSALTNSKWDEAVDTVNDLLMEDRPTYKAMTEDQIAELESVKVLLLERTDDKSDKMRHLPLKLLGSGLRKLGKTSSQEDVVDHETAAFIMREFGGVTVPADNSSQRGTSTTSELINTEEDVEGTTSRSEDASLFLLPEFKDLSKESQRKVCKMLSWDSVKTWGFNVFDLVDTVGEKPLLFMGWAVIGAPYAQQAMARACGMPEPLNDGYDFVDSELQIPLDILCDYLRSIDNDYRAGNPYHNATHAADVLQSLHALIQMKPDLHCSKVELFSILLAAAVHDVEHPGQNNAFQVNCKSDLALIYNDHSVLENKHVSHAFMEMLGDDSNQLANRSRCTSHINHGSDSGLNVLCNASEKIMKAVRSKVIDAILNTDMSKHFVMVNTLKGFVMGMEEGAELDDESRWKVLVYMMHLADISGQAKPDPLFLIWTDRVMEEIFAQGDKEAELGLPISQLCDRKTTNPHDSQIGFIDFVIQPAYEVLGELVPEVQRLVLPMIQSNHDYFVREKEAEKPQECAL